MKRITRNLALIGFKASGKTTLGKRLAHALQWTFIDTDQLIEQHHPYMSCREIFQTFGGHYFRDLESQAIASLKHPSPFVLATGGGSLLQSSNGTELKARAILIYLKTSADVLKKRLWERQTLPAYLNGGDPDQAFETLYKELTIVYDQWADQTLDMDGLSEEEALKQLVRMGL
jgi:shikimate kinase